MQNQNNTEQHLQFENIEECCNYFQIANILNTEYFENAITHSSVQNKQNYEKLEFFGDTILNFAISKMLFENYNNTKNHESDLAKLKSFLVSSEVCSQVCYQIGLDKEIKTQNILKSDAQTLPESITADCVESFIAVVYINHGEQKIHNFIKTIFSRYILEYQQDPKTQLQELAHKKYKTNPIYTIVKKDGSDHNPTFTVSVKINKMEEFGTGLNKKLAEKNASSKMLDRILK
jgi:ribonuclease-3